MKTSVTRAERIQEIRAEAKKVGLDFVPLCSGRNGYRFYDESSGVLRLCSNTIAEAYANLCSGYLSSYNRVTARFEYLYGLRRLEAASQNCKNV